MMAALRSVGDGAGCSSMANTVPTMQQMLQSAVQSLQWTYSLFWQLCPQQGVLVWAEGYYNGAIKTRKMVQPVEAMAEEAPLQRSLQLRELYESLSMGETNQPARRPCAALSPEDLTESEWFYLMCISFFFPPGVGLPGKAFERQQPVWLSGAKEVGTNVFSRAILAKGAQIQTVVCIPLADGVLELGTTDKVKEDPALIQQVKSVFAGHPVYTTDKPALSEHSTSNPAPSAAARQLFRSPSLPIMPPAAAAAEDSHGLYDEEGGEEEEEDDDDDGDGGAGSDSDCEGDTTSGGGVAGGFIRPRAMATGVAAEAEPSELMQMEMPEEIRVGSPDDCSNTLDADLQVPEVYGTDGGRSGGQHHGGDCQCQAWPPLHDDATNSLPLSSAATAIQSISQEDAHYSQTVSTILQHGSRKWADSCCSGYLEHPRPLAFSSWSCCRVGALPPRTEGASQWLLKHALRCIPYLHGIYKDESSPKPRDGEGGPRFRRGTSQDELGASHVLAERRRREKLNERFIVLRSLVPCVTKMDKASILGDTIDYLKQLLRRIQEMETLIKLMNGERRTRSMEASRPKLREQSIQTASSSPPADAARHFTNDRSGTTGLNKKKLRALDGGSGPVKGKAMEDSSIQVSIIETDALLELQCPHKDGLLLKIMQAVYELGLETTAVQSSSADGIFVAEIRAKVRENVHGKRASIVEVKKALHHVLSQNWC